MRCLGAAMRLRRETRRRSALTPVELSGRKLIDVEARVTEQAPHGGGYLLAMDSQRCEAVAPMAELAPEDAQIAGHEGSQQREHLLVGKPFLPMSTPIWRARIRRR